MISALPISPSPREGKSPPLSGTDDLVEMLPELYDELRSLAANYLRNERPGHTLQRTALVHEAYLRIVKDGRVVCRNRAQFFAVFARIMRETLTNYAIARARTKRGGKDRLEAAIEFYDRLKVDVSAVDLSLHELQDLDSRQAQIVELRFFGGLSVSEIATTTGLSPATIKREWASAKIWLRRKLFEDMERSESKRVALSPQ
jgi:RNA polymerase sigma factor (TIGR02999 family)